MKTRFAAFFLMMVSMLAVCAAAQETDLDLPALSPIAVDAQAQTAELYFGPTQGFYRENGAVIDLNKPFVYFGQADCWAMVASGTPESMGTVGWIEAGYADLPDMPQLDFVDALPAMIEEDAPLTAEPFTASPQTLTVLPRGTQVLLLAQTDEWVYVQTELQDTPIRAFIPLSSL